MRASKKMTFAATLVGETVKTFIAVQMDTIYKGYNNYCKKRGFRMLIRDPESFGSVAWQNEETGQVLRLKRLA